MKQENEKVYEDIIETWSRIYKSKIGDLFTLEELKQEAWLSILMAEDHAKKVATDKIAFLSQCVKNSLLKMFLDELKHKIGKYDTAEDFCRVDLTTPEETQSSDELYKKLKINIRRIPNADFIFPYMNIKTVREISEIAKKEGIQISKSQVHNIIIMIRKELDKLLLRR